MNPNPQGNGLMSDPQQTSVNTQPVGGYPNGGTPTTTTTPGAYGGGGLINIQNPMSVVRAYMQSHGLDPDSNGFMAPGIQRMMQALIPAIMKLTLDSHGQPAADRLANINSVLDPLFYGGAGTMAGNLRGYGQQVLGQFPHIDFSGMAADNQADLLRNVQALSSFGGNQYVTSAANNRLDQAINAATDQQYQQNLAHGGDKTKTNLWDFIQHYAPGNGYINPLR